jgi:hypothetical protein
MPDAPYSREVRIVQRVIAAHGLHCGALIDQSGVVVVHVGDFHTYGNEGLVSALLGPYGDPAATFGMLESQLLPRMMGQGQHFAFVDRVGENFAAVVFGFAKERRDAVSEYQLSQAVHRTLVAAFET